MLPDESGSELYCTSCGSRITRTACYCEACGEPLRPDLELLATEEVKLAGLGRRAGAIIIDTMILLFSWYLTLALLGISMLSGGGPVIGFEGAMVLDLIFIVGYTILLEGYWNGQTIGKSVFDIRVIRSDTGKPIGRDKAIVRNVARVIDFLPLFYIFAILTVSYMDANQRIGDIIAETIVVKV